MPPILQIDSLTKRFGDLTLYENISFGVAQGQKIGLIARNGAGKTTLLNIISGKENSDEGSVIFRNDLNVAYLEQSPQFDAGLTALEACLHIHKKSFVTGDETENELSAKQMLSRLKISDFNQKVETLSGGQLKRVALAKALITKPDFIMLDEPTNHLDLEMIEWLEDYLRRSNLSLLMVTHDRYFLDAVCNEIVEIDNKQIYSYKGNYSYYLAKRAERIEATRAALDHANNLLRKELDWMRRQPQARATKAKARIDAFYELEKRASQKPDDRNVSLNVKASYIGSKIFEAEHVCKSFGEIRITDDFNYIFSRYEKLGIVGDNGTGKSTFIKMLMGEVHPDSGRFTVGETVRFGYYSQEGLQFDDRMKVIDVVRDIAEYITLGNGKSLTVSQFLNHFLFSPSQQHNYIAKLSGGERRRLYLCTVLMRNPNFLVLDEPTNDLDIATLNILEEYLVDFKGCVLVISHDRYFMDRIVDHLLVFHGNADIQDFPGNYTQYRLWKSQQQPETQPVKEAEKSNYRKPSPKKLTYREQRELEALEQEIPLLEAEKQQIETALSSGALTVSELNTYTVRYGELLKELDAKTERWIELSDMQE